MLSALLLLLSAAMWANDGVYYVSGNQLVPVKETDIAVTKEILTIEIGDDEYANVDVYYEFTNNGSAKTVTMGFEAMLPYEGGESVLNRQGVHPYIKDFKALFNGTQLTYSTGVVAVNGENGYSDMKPLDMRKWRYEFNFPDNDYAQQWDMVEGHLVNGHDTIMTVAYAYYFEAKFQPGKNIVKHTYRYRMSSDVMHDFSIPYMLTPATRWANHQIDDFTLCIKAPKGIKHFYMPDHIFRSAPFRVVSGVGKTRHCDKNEDDNVWTDYTEVSLRHGAVEWKARNFRPTDELFIRSAKGLPGNLLVGAYYSSTPFWCSEDVDSQLFYGRPDCSEEEEQALVKRIRRNLPYAARGYVFRDKKLQHFFDNQWWYMPDPNWKMSTDDFSKFDWELINGLEE